MQVEVLQPDAVLTALNQELVAGQLVFPTQVDVALRVQRALEDPDVHLQEAARIVANEPLLAAKTLAMANSAAIRQQGPEVGDLVRAVNRLGIGTLRTLAVTLVLRQIIYAEPRRIEAHIAAALWVHAIHIAALASTLARRTRTLNPQEALVAGLLHDIGHFYLLSRSHLYPMLLDRAHPASALVYTDHAYVSRAVMKSLDVPQIIIEATEESDLYGPLFPPRSLADTISLAHLITPFGNPLLDEDAADPALALTDGVEIQGLAEFAEEARQEVESMAQALNA